VVGIAHVERRDIILLAAKYTDKVLAMLNQHRWCWMGLGPMSRPVNVF
jgi:hypothetical protein